MSKSSDITEFQGEYRFLSNFWPARVMLTDVYYPTVENAYQAAKTTNRLLRTVFVDCMPGEAKRAGKCLRVRSDWDVVKERAMLSLLRFKFASKLHPALTKSLLATDERCLIEGNRWGDTYWGVCEGVGQNRLGLLLMQVRGELRERKKK